MFQRQLQSNHPARCPGTSSHLIASLFLVALAWGIPIIPVKAQVTAFTDENIKAALMCKLASLVEWPDEAFSSDPDRLILGILGDDPFGSDLEQIVSKQRPQGRSIVIRRFPAYLSAVDECHLVFISRSLADQTGELDSLRGKPILMFADDERLWHWGVHVNFVVVAPGSQKGGKNVRFDINGEGAAKAGFKMGAQLLKNARNKGEKP